MAGAAPSAFRTTAPTVTHPVDRTPAREGAAPNPFELVEVWQWTGRQWLREGAYHRYFAEALLRAHCIGWVSEVRQIRPLRAAPPADPD